MKKVRIKASLLLASDIDLAYLAGLLDGEGSFMVLRPKRAEGRVYPCVSIGMTHKATISWISSLLEINFHTRLNGYGLYYTVYITGCNAVDLSKAVLPYLKTKLWAANILVKFDGMIGVHATLPLSMKIKREEFYVEYKKGECSVVEHSKV